jgi:TonB family protein
MRYVIEARADWQLAASSSKMSRSETQRLTFQVLKSAPYWVFALIAVSLSDSEAQSKTDTSEVAGSHAIQIAKVTPEFPHELRNTPYFEGFAKVVFMVDEAGNNYDFILAEATHPRFGAKALEALRKWKVTPPIVDGQPRPTRHVVTVKFSQNGPVLIDRPIAETAGPHESIQNRSLHYRVCELGDLDRLPRRIETAVPVLPEGVSVDVASGIARIQFFIDKEGRVRAPGVLFSTSDVIADAAITAITDWRFEPPRKNGNPVVVHAVQTIQFKIDGAEKPYRD